MGKFYRIVPDPGGNETWDEVEDNDGGWAKRDDYEQLEKERDELKRKGEELCFAYGQSLIELGQWKRDAVRFARVAQQKIYELYDGQASHMNEVEYQEAQTIIDRYKNPMAVASGSGRRGDTWLQIMTQRTFILKF